MPRSPWNSDQKRENAVGAEGPPGADLVPAQPGFAAQGKLAAYLDRDFNPDERYSAAAREMLDEAIPKNTRESYLRAAWRYVQWCGETGRQHLPATPATVVEFILYLGRQPGRYNGPGLDGKPMKFRPLAPESVRMHLKVISRAHRMAPRPERDSAGRSFIGYESPTKHPDVRDVFKVYKQRWLKDGHRPDTASDLTPEELTAMVGTLDDRSTRGIRDAAMLCVTYDAGLRKEELSALNREDVTFTVAVDGVEIVVLAIRMSKTDQAGDGDEVLLHAHPAPFAATCPVRRLRMWIERCDAAGFTDGPLFRKLAGGGPSPADGRPRKSRILPGRITGLSLEAVVADTGEAAGLVGKEIPVRQRRHLVPHSLRAGSATAAAEAGADTPELNRHYRWSPNSTTANRYATRGKRRRRQTPSRRIWESRDAGEGGGSDALGDGPGGR